MNKTVKPKIKAIQNKWYTNISHHEIQFLPGDLKMNIFRQFAANVLSCVELCNELLFMKSNFLEITY